MSGAPPPPAARPLERAAGVPLPVCPGCGRCGRVDPAPAPQRAPLRAGVARCGGGGRASPGGVPSTVVRGAWCQALSLPRPPVLWSGQPGFRYPCVPGAVDAGVWAQHRPHSVRPCGPALLAVGVVEGRPRGGVPSTVVRGAWCQAHPLPRPPVLWSGQPGFRCACVCVCVLCLAGSGGPASRARSGAPHLSLWPLCLSPLLGPLRAGVAPLSLAAVVVPGALCWFFFFFFFPPPAALLSLRSRLVCVPCLAVGCSLVVAPAVFVAPAWCLGVFFFFFFFLVLLSPALFALLACRFSALRALVLLSCFPPGCWLLPGGCCPPPPPLLCSSRFSSLPLGAVCRVVLCVPGSALRRPAARCVARCCAVVCCVTLVWCRCLLRRALWRCPSPWGPVLCGVVFCGVPPRCVLCAVCVLSWRGGACCCSPLCFVLCVSRGAVLCVPCALRSVRCCASLCWCGRVVLFVWCVLLLAPGAVVRCCVLCCFLWCAVVRCWVCWPVVVCWWRVSVSLSLSGRVICFPVVGVVCCGALLSCVVFCGAVLSVVLCCCALLSFCGAVGACLALLWAVVLCCVVLLVGCAVFCLVVVSACCGALFLVLCFPCLLLSVRCGALLCWPWCPASLCRVLWRCAVVWCCAVVLCCRFAVLFVFALPSCGPSCGASVVCAVVGASCCGVSLCVVVSPWAFCGVVVLLWCVVVSCCAGALSCGVLRPVSCPAVPCCPAGLCWFVSCVGVVVPT